MKQARNFPPARPLVVYDLLMFTKSYCAECRRYGEPVNAHGLAREFRIYDQGRHDWEFYLHHAGRLCAVWLANEDRMIRAAYRTHKQRELAAVAG